MSIDLAIVPVAGLGVRLLPLTKSEPKEMLPIGRKPVVQYVVEELADAGLKRLIFVTGPGKTAIENHFDINGELTDFLRETGREDLLEELEYERKDVEYFYTRQRRQLGLGNAVSCARSLVQNQPFVVALGDSIIGMDDQPGTANSQIVRRMTEQFERSGVQAVIALEEVPPEDVEQYGIAEPRQAPQGEAFELAGLVEKPVPSEARSNLAIAGRYVFSPAIFDYLEATGFGKRNQIELTDALGRMIADGGKVLGMRLAPSERRYDIGGFESYFRAFVKFALADPRYGTRLQQELGDLLKDG